MKKEIAEFISNCANFQQVKVEHQNSGDLLQEIKVPTWELEDINMVFVVGLPCTRRQYDSIWVVVDWLTKCVHFITVKSTYSAEDYARIFVDEIVCQHGILLSVISDRSARLISRFWNSFQEGLSIKVKLSTAFHP